MDKNKCYYVKYLWNGNFSHVVEEVEILGSNNSLTATKYLIKDSKGELKVVYDTELFTKKKICP